MNVPNWKLERYRLGELSEADARQVSEALAADVSLRERLTALEADDASTLRAHPPARVAARVSASARDAATLRAARTSWLAPAFALAAVALVVVLWQAWPPDEDVTRPKGDIALRLFRLTHADPERLSEGAPVKPHDVVQVAFDLQGKEYAVVVSVDGAGEATLHWPHGPDARTPPGFKTLPQSFELDEAPGFERFFLIASDEPLAVEQLYAAAKQAGRTGALPIPPAASQRSLLLEKVSP